MKQRGKILKTWYIWIWPTTYLLSLIPVLLLEKYNFPSADDFGFSTYTRLAWADTHNFRAVLAAACRKVAEVWQTWQGTYSSVFLMALQPGIFGDGFYWITTWIMIGGLTLSVWYLFKVIFQECLNGHRGISIAVASVYLLIAVQCMIDKTQGFFWYNGAVHYMVPQAALFFLTGMVLKMIRTEATKMQHVVAGVLLIVYIGGGNLITGLECGIWLVTAIAFLIFVKRKSMVRSLFLFLGAWVLGFGINVMAPGNSYRQAAFTDRPGIIRSVLQSFYYCLDFVFKQWQSWAILLLVLLVLPYVIEAVQNYQGNFRFPCPLLVPIYSYCLLASMFTPSIYANGQPGAGRIYNIIYLTYLLLIVVNLVYLYGWYWKKYGVEKKLEEKDERIWQAAVLLVAGFCFCIEAGVDTGSFTSTSAMMSLISGEAQEYKMQQDQRMKLLLDESVTDVALQAFSIKPELLYYEDIEYDPSGWINTRMANYYRKSVVWLEDE